MPGLSKHPGEVKRNACRRAGGKGLQQTGIEAEYRNRRGDGKCKRPWVDAGERQSVTWFTYRHRDWGY